MERTQIKKQKRGDGVSTALFELFVYEVIATLEQKHKALPEEK